MKNAQKLPLFVWLLALTAGLVALLSAVSRLSRPALSPTQRVHAHVARELRALSRLVDAHLLPLAERSGQTDSLRSVFLACRTAYKRVEPFTEYYFPTTSRLVNGPPLPEIEVEETKEFEPGGLQVIEELLYPERTDDDRAELVREVRKLRRELLRYEKLWEATELTDQHVFDALRLQLFRVQTLGISGFDTPLCRTALPEAATALTAVGHYVQFYAPTERSGAHYVRSDSVRSHYVAFRQRLDAAETYLRQHPDFDPFDRAVFLTQYASPLSRALGAYGRAQGIAPFTEPRPLRATATTLFDADAFDADAYAPTADARQNPAKIELGRRLFYDPVLSGDGRRSCASCHQPDKAFTDGLVKNKTLTGQGLIGRNTPTLLNAALQVGQFYDMRSASLENQSFDVVHNADEMHGSLDVVARKLQADAHYVALFRRAFPERTGPIAPTHIQNALASYERTLTTFNSRFDRYMRGDNRALTAEEVRGFNLFMGKAKCGICHFMPLFNGTVPPAYAKTESEVIGVPASAAGSRIDPDLGRYAHTRLDPLRYAFKTPTVRNVAKTAPYMHNGVYQTLEAVVDFYDQGGGTGLGFALENQTLPGDKLHLSPSEKKALVAFMKAL